MIILRYFFKELYSSVLAVTLTLIVIFIGYQFIFLMNYAADGRLPISAVMKIMSLQVPMLLGFILPLSMYVSTLLVFGRMYIDSEMTILFACGVSKVRLTAIVMAFAGLLSIIVAWLLFSVVPVIQNYKVAFRSNISLLQIVGNVVPGQFQSLGHNGVFYAGGSDGHGQLKHVFLAQQQNQQGQSIWNVSVADYISQKKESDGRYLVFHNGYRYAGKAGTNTFSVTQFKEYGMKGVVKAESNDKSPIQESMGQLWAQRHDPNAAAELQWRIAMPISLLLLTLLAIPLSEVKPRQGMFGRLFPAIVVYAAYANLVYVGRSWIRKGVVSPTVGLWWLHGTVLLLIILFTLHRFGWQRFFDSVLRRRKHAAD